MGTFLLDATRALIKAPPKIGSVLRVSTRTSTPGSERNSAVLDATRGRFEAVMRLGAGGTFDEAIISLLGDINEP